MTTDKDRYYNKTRFVVSTHAFIGDDITISDTYGAPNDYMGMSLKQAEHLIIELQTMIARVKSMYDELERILDNGG